MNYESYVLLKELPKNNNRPTELIKKGEFEFAKIIAKIKYRQTLLKDLGVKSNKWKY